MNIAVAGTGYVGLSIATLLSQHHHVLAVDVVPEKVKMINARKSPIQDEYIEKYLAEKQLDLTATLDAETAYRQADFVVIATPTNYDPQKNFFDTSHVEEVVDLVLRVNPKAVMIIKSTIPVGYTESVREKFSWRERRAEMAGYYQVPANGIEKRRKKSCRGLSSHHEIKFRQFPAEFHPGRNEVHQGEGRESDYLRTDPRGRTSFFGSMVVKDIDKFKAQCNCVLANRYDDRVLDDVKDKVYIRDISSRDSRGGTAVRRSQHRHGNSEQFTW